MNITTTHPCQTHHLLPVGVLVCTSVLTGMVCLLTLNAYFFCNTAVRFQMVRRLSSKSERRCVVVHYLVLLPLFTIFVVWGPHLQIGVLPNGSSVLAAWVGVLVTCLVLLAMGFWSVKAYMWSLELSQVLQAPAMLFFLCDRALYHALGVESIFVASLLFVVVLEMVFRGTPARQMIQPNEVRLDEFAERMQPEHLRSYNGATHKLNGHDDPNYESGLDSEVLEEHRARNSATQLVDFMHRLSRIDIKTVSSKQEREQLESLQRQASLYTTVVPLPALRQQTSRSKQDISNSAQLDSLGFLADDSNGDDDF